jgi:hypothetical protein
VASVGIARLLREVRTRPGEGPPCGRKASRATRKLAQLLSGLADVGSLTESRHDKRCSKPLAMASQALFGALHAPESLTSVHDQCRVA